MGIPGCTQQASAEMPPHGFFAMVTAAVIMGVPLPYQHQNSRLLHIAVPDPARRRVR